MKEVNRTSALWEQFEKLVLAWRQLGEEDSAVRLSLNLEFTDVLSALFPKQETMEIMTFIWEEVLTKYDPAKGAFRSFVTSRLKLRKDDMRHEDAGDRRVTVKEDGEQRQKWVPGISLDTPADEESHETIGNQIADRNTISGQSFLEAEENEVALISLILTLPQRLNGQARNPKRINYFRMFFTDDSVEKIHTAGGRFYFARERDLFQAMTLPFLDFFMGGSCRSVRSILRTDLKAYGQMVPGRPMEPPRRPPYKEGYLPADIYMRYLNAQTDFKIKSPSSLSEQWGAYVKFLEDYGL